MVLCLKTGPVGGTVEIPTCTLLLFPKATKDIVHYNIWVCLSFLILEINHLRLHNVTFPGGQMKMRGGNSWREKNPKQEPEISGLDYFVVFLPFMSLP